MQKKASSILVRGLDAEIKKRLRVRAASHGRSMEEEVRTLIRDSVAGPAETGAGLGTAIRKLFEGLGDFDLEPLPRQLVSEPPDFSGPEYDPK